MEILFIILIIAVPIISVLGWIVWMVVIGFIAKKSFEAASTSKTIGGLGGGIGYGEFDALLAQLDQAMRVASAGQGGPAAGGEGLQNLSPQQQLQIQTMMMSAQNQMAQMDTLGRQRYETRMADLSGMAANAGLDWTPGSY